MMEIDPPANFATKDDEVRYWMHLAQQMHRRKVDVEREMVEYQENSLIIEKELESSYEQTDRINNDLRQQVKHLTEDNGQLRERLKQQTAAYASLQIQIVNVKDQNEDLHKSIRQLEQTNDDLERANREMKMTEEETESQLNIVLEKLAMLETEVDEKEELKVMVQRLRDENKDLQQQIQILESRLVVADNKKASNGLEVGGIGSPSSYRLSDSCMQTTPQHYEQIRNNNVFKYVMELEQKIKMMEKAQSKSREAEEETSAKFSLALEKIAVLESELSEKESLEAAAQKPVVDESKDLAQETQVRLRPAHKEKPERVRPRSVKEEEKPRASVSGRSSRHYIESRVKKVKDEEKRQQNLMWFLRRLRHSQPGWMRKKE